MPMAFFTAFVWLMIFTNLYDSHLRGLTFIRIRREIVIFISFFFYWGYGNGQNYYVHYILKTKRSFAPKMISYIYCNIDAEKKEII